MKLESSKRPYQILFFIFLIVFAGSCKSEKFEKIEDIPKPVSAYQKSFEGDYKIKLLNDLTFVSNNLKADYNIIKEDIFFLPAETKWTEINDFYQNDFSNKGWKIDKKAVRENGNYKFTVWKPDSLLNDQAVAVAMIETSARKPENNRKFLILFLLEE